MTACMPAMRAHARAVFSVEGGLPPYIQEQQRRLESAIDQAGLAGKLPHLLSSIVADRRRADEPFELFVLGEGKFGKSTLVNALLAYRIAPTDFTPKTWCFNRYVATTSPPPYVRVFVSEDLRQRQDAEHLHRWLRRPQGSFRSLTEYHVPPQDAEELADTEEQRVKATFNRSDAYWSPVMEMEWTVPPDGAIVPGIRLVDTMGINQDVAAPKAHLHYLRWQYERADAVLWLVSFDRLNAAATRAQLQEARRYSKVVYLLITRWDLANDKENLLARAQDLYGSLCTAILPVSALAELAAQGLLEQTASNERAFLARHGKLGADELHRLSGFDPLRNALQQFLDGRHLAIRHSQMYSALRQKGREFRQVALQVRDDAHANITLHEDLVKELKQARDDTLGLVQRTFNKASARWNKSVKKKLKKINFSNRHAVDSLMGTDTIDGEFRHLQAKVAEEIEKRFAEVVRWAASSDRCYRTSEFGPTGDVEDVALTASVGSPEVVRSVMALSLKRFSPEPPSSLLDLIIGSLKNVWDRIQASFDSAYRERVVGELKQEIRDAWIPELERAGEEARSHYESQISSLFNQFSTDFSAQYERSGGDVAHRVAIERIDSVLGRTIVEPVLIAVPVRLMRHFRWRY